MTLREATPTELAAWDDLVWANPGGPDLYQLDSYARFKAPAWRARRLVHEHEGLPPVHALYLVRRLPPFGELWYCPMGPRVPDADHARRCVEDLRTGEVGRPFLVVLEPSVPATGPQDRERLIASIPGMRSVPDLQQGQHTVVVDLRPSEEEILAGFRQRARRHLRKTAEAVVEHRTDAEAFAIMWDLFSHTMERAGVDFRSREYHQGIWRDYIDAGMGHFVLARPRPGGEVEAGAFVVHHRELGYYKDGGSLRTQDSNGLQYRVQWEAMRWCRERGVTDYDMYSTPPSWLADDPGHKAHPLVQFKTAFAPIVDHVGTMQLVLRPRVVRAWDLVGMPVHRRLAERTPAGMFF
ncbi:lipid II:glycine glycyltransferase FemX [Ornithinimicrobium flavum]|uniref:lipid II:glycine glycyltransferase FemX n=1 Tax=Ornithinimicrobium flavum TaxID=1288636 RepID=UPI00106FE5DC|nr:peptidoglycan bridge formation glycyltransferase FemA/FemB family protein [Ornithinimicrobium flavum]